MTAKIFGSAPIGVIGSISSLVFIIATIDVLNMSLGMKRSLGIAVSKNDFSRFKQILSSAILFVMLLVIVSIIIFAIPNLRLFEIIGLDRQYEWIVIAMIPAWSYQFIFSEAIIAARSSRDLVTPFLLGSILRFPVLFLAYYLTGSTSPILATLLAYSTALFVSTVYLGSLVFKFFRRSRDSALHNVVSNIKGILTASLASWIPTVINVVGVQLSVIAVASSHGSSEAGKFYIAFGIFNVLLALVLSISRVTHSWIPGIDKEEDQTKFLSFSLKWGFLIVFPIAAPILFFPANFLQLMGGEFRDAAGALSVFMVGVPLAIICETVYYFIYGRGDLRSLLYLGLAGSITRIIFYIALIPTLGSMGAAIAYVAGSSAQLLIVIILKPKHSLVLQFRKYFVITIVPLVIGSVTWLVQINFLMASIIILLCSFLLYVKLDLLPERELYGLIYEIFPIHVADRVYPIVSKVVQKIT